MKYDGVFLGLLMGCLSTLYGQVGIGTNTPDPSAALEVVATAQDKGVLIPRLTQAQRNAIASPANGLLIYQTDINPGLYSYDGTTWAAFGEVRSVNGQLPNIITGEVLIPANTDSQTLSLVGQILSISSGNSITLIDTNTDSQTLTLSGQVLTISSGNSVTLANTNTDTQTLTANLSGTDLRLQITGSSTQTVGLSALSNTDSQTLSLAGQVLTISAGNSVTLSDTNTDSQTLTLTGQVLTISSGNSVTLANTNTDTQTLTANLSGTDLRLQITGSSTQTVGLSALSNTDSQTLSLAGQVLTISAGNSVTLSDTNTDSQTLTLTGQVLTISSGNSVTLANTNTDTQTLAANLSGTDLRLQITGSSTQTVDLSALSNTDSQTLTLVGQVLTISSGNSVTLANTNTDTQTLTANLSGTDLRLQITGSSTQTVGLSALSNTDSQTLSLAGQVLTISAGNSVTLSNTNTDSQTLTLVGQVLTISSGNSVTLANTNTDTQTIHGSLVGNTLNLWNQGTTSSATINLSALANTDSQTLTLTGQVLTISAGNSVTLANTNTDTQTLAANLSGTDLRLQITGSSTQTVGLSSLTNTDSQTLSIAGQVLTISAGNSVTIADTNTDTQTLAEVTLQGTQTTEVIQVAGMEDTSLGTTNELIYVGLNKRLSSSSSLTLDPTNGDLIITGTLSATNIDVTGTITTSADLNVKGDSRFEGDITTTDADLTFEDTNGVYPTSGKGFFWRLNNDIAKIYAVQPGSDKIDFYFNLADNTNNLDDRYIFWHRHYGSDLNDDRFPLVMNSDYFYVFADPSTTEAIPDLSDRAMRVSRWGDVEIKDDLTVSDDLTVGGSGTVGGSNITSDIRLKSNIELSPYGLEEVLLFSPKKYLKFKTPAKKTLVHKEIGFIAQEVQEIIPDIVRESSDKDGTLSLNYNAFIPVLTKAIQEQQIQIEQLQSIIQQQKKEIQRLRELENLILRVEQLEALVQKKEKY